MNNTHKQAAEQNKLLDDAFDRLRSPTKPASLLNVTISVLTSEVAHLERERVVMREQYVGQNVDALARAAEVERLLADEYASKEVMVFEESERRARAEVENGRRCAVLQARLEAAHEDAHAEGRRAAALEAAKTS